MAADAVAVAVAGAIASAVVETVAVAVAADVAVGGDVAAGYAAVEESFVAVAVDDKAEHTVGGVVVVAAAVVEDDTADPWEPAGIVGMGERPRWAGSGRGSLRYGSSSVEAGYGPSFVAVRVASANYSVRGCGVLSWRSWTGVGGLRT